MPTPHPRYEGNMLLLLLEKYVLWAIGELDGKDAANLEAMTPNLNRTFKSDGDWQRAIATAMDLPDNMPDLIRANWAKNQEIAANNGVTLPPQQFAEMFVDSNLV